MALLFPWVLGTSLWSDSDPRLSHLSLQPCATGHRFVGVLLSMRRVQTKPNRNETKRTHNVTKSEPTRKKTHRYGSWRWNGARQKRPMSSIVLEPGVKDMLLADCRDFLRSEDWYAERGQYLSSFHSLFMTIAHCHCQLPISPFPMPLCVILFRFTCSDFDRFVLWLSALAVDCMPAVAFTPLWLLPLSLRVLVNGRDELMNQYDERELTELCFDRYSVPSWVPFAWCPWQVRSIRMGFYLRC